MPDGEGLRALDQRLRERVGDDYHGLFRCWTDDGLRFEEIYLRGDIRERYTDEDREAMTREAVFRALEEGYLEDIYQLGDRTFTIEWFEHAALLFLARDEHEAVVVGLEADPALDHAAIALDCRDVLDGE